MGHPRDLAGDTRCRNYSEHSLDGFHAKTTSKQRRFGSGHVCMLDDTSDSLNPVSCVMVLLSRLSLDCQCDFVTTPPHLKIWDCPKRTPSFSYSHAHMHAHAGGWVRMLVLNHHTTHTHTHTISRAWILSFSRILTHICSERGREREREQS